jgi:hypothetical protein
VKGARPCIAHCTLARLLDADRMPLCRRSMLGRILESWHISHIDVESASRACHLRRGRARAREAVARGLGRSLCFAVCFFACPRPARKPPVHGLCCRTFVSCRVLFGGIYIYIVYKCVCPWLSADHSRATRENIRERDFDPITVVPDPHVPVSSITICKSHDRVGRSISRPAHHRVVSGQLQDGQTPTIRPRSRV